MAYESDMYGWSGRLLEIDLSTHTHRIVLPDQELLWNCLGGRGLAAGLSLLTPEYTGADRPVFILGGPLTGADIPGADFVCLWHLSAIDNMPGMGRGGPLFGQALKSNGFDGIILRGRSEQPLHIIVKKGHVEFSATDLRPAPDSGCLRTGKAAFAGVFSSAVLLDGQPCFAGGLARELASRNCTGLIVNRGPLSVCAFSSIEKDAAITDIQRLLNASPTLMGELGFRHHGETALFDLLLDRHMLPIYNFRATWMKELEHCRTGADHRPSNEIPCGNCPVGCHRARNEKPAPDLRAKIAFCSLGAAGDENLADACWQICLEYGLDPVETAAVIACHLEIEDIPPRAAAILHLIEGMVHGKTPGRELAAGARVYADTHGRPETAMTIGSRALPPIDPRGAAGHALSLCVSTCGPDEFQALALAHEILRKPVATNRFAFEGKARLNVISENFGAAADSLCFCPWYRIAVGGEEMARALQAITGLECDARRLALCGQKTIMAEARLARGEHEQWPLHTLPPVFFSTAGTPGPGLDIPPLNREKLEQARGRYLAIRLASQSEPECTR